MDNFVTTLQQCYGALVKMSSLPFTDHTDVQIGSHNPLFNNSLVGENAEASIPYSVLPAIHRFLIAGQARL